MANRCLDKGPARKPNYEPKVIKHNPVQIISVMLDTKYTFLAPVDCTLGDFTTLPADRDLLMYQELEKDSIKLATSPSVSLKQGEALHFEHAGITPLSFTVRTTHAPDTVV